MNKQNVFITLVVVLLVLGCANSVPQHEPTNEQENQVADVTTAVNATAKPDDMAAFATPEPIMAATTEADALTDSVESPPEPESFVEAGVTIKTLTEEGGRLDISPDGTIIAYDKRGSDGYYDVWTMSLDGENQTCLTCDYPILPTRNVGLPAWHPSGSYLVVQVEKQVHQEGIASGLAASPGAGYYNDLWIIEVGTDKAWLVHEVPEGKDHGILHPHFSSDGTKLSWSQAFRDIEVNDPAKIAGSWELKVADVMIDDAGIVSLANIQTFQPGAEVIYENHGFSPDGEKLIFTSNMVADVPVTSADIYTLEIATGTLTALTNSGYNEHAQYSPDGSKIVWMSTNGNIPPEDVSEIGYTDWWIMNADGSEKQRLTYFNQEGHPHFVVWGTVAADYAWMPDNSGFIGYYFTFSLEVLLRGEFREVIVQVDLQDTP